MDMDMRVHVTGIDELIRKFDRLQDGVEEALDIGCQDAAEYLQERIEDKFGTYQNGWKPLKYITIYRKRRKGNGANANKPLVDFGDMMFSFYTVITNRTRKHTVTIKSDDPKILYHMYGARKSGLPKRDPVRPTVAEEREKCHDIIRDAVKDVIKDVF